MRPIQCRPMSRARPDYARGAAKTYPPKGTHPLEASSGRRTRSNRRRPTSGVMQWRQVRYRRLAVGSATSLETAIVRHRRRSIPGAKLLYHPVRRARHVALPPLARRCVRGRVGVVARCVVAPRLERRYFCVGCVGIKAGAWICNRMTKLASVPPELV